MPRCRRGWIGCFHHLLGEDHFQRPNRRFEDGRFFQVVSGFGPESRSFFFEVVNPLWCGETPGSPDFLFFSLNQDSKSMVKLNKLKMLYEPIWFCQVWHPTICRNVTLLEKKNAARRCHLCSICTATERSIILCECRLRNCTLIDSQSLGWWRVAVVQHGSIHVMKIQVALRPKWFIEYHYINWFKVLLMCFFVYVEARIETPIYSRSPGRSRGFWVCEDCQLLNTLPGLRSDWLYQHPFGWVYANVLTCPRPLHPYFFGKTIERNCDSLVCKRWDGANVLEIIHYCFISGL
jgi:hypothetical protein